MVKSLEEIGFKAQGNRYTIPFKSFSFELGKDPLTITTKYGTVYLDYQDGWKVWTTKDSEFCFIESPDAVFIQDKLVSVPMPNEIKKSASVSIRDLVSIMDAVFQVILKMNNQITIPAEYHLYKYNLTSYDETRIIAEKLGLPLINDWIELEDYKLIAYTPSLSVARIHLKDMTVRFIIHKRTTEVQVPEKNVIFYLKDPIEISGDKSDVRFRVLRVMKL